MFPVRTVVSLALTTAKLLSHELRQMSSALARYENFLLSNASTVSTLESSLRSLTWLLPGRFKDAELASEACEYINPVSVSCYTEMHFQCQPRSIS